MKPALLAFLACKVKGMQQIPVYAFTGFLDSGKTKFIQETLEDPRFNAGERTLVLVFEEGEEEFDISTYPHQNVYLEVLDQQTVTTKELQVLAKKHKAQRVVAELNGMQLVGDLYLRFPENWVVAQEVMFADSTTFMAYNANMRNLVMDKLMGAQMVVFNRLTPGQDTIRSPGPPAAGSIFFTIIRTAQLPLMMWRILCPLISTRTLSRSRIRIMPFGTVM